MFSNYTIHISEDILQLIFQTLVKLESNGGKLIVEHTDEHDQGQWFCTAESEIGKDIKTFDIDILIPPQILQSQMADSKKVLEGDNLELHCDVEGKGSTD